MGSHPESIAASGRQLYGKFRGIVTDDNDPTNLGRVKANVPAVLGNVPTGWAMPAFVYSGDAEGFYMVPPVGAGVWIEFECGDISRPIWSGCWFAAGELPETETGNAAKPKIKILRSHEGMLIAFDDSAKTLTLSDSDGGNRMVIKVSQGQIRIEAKTKVIIEAPQIELVDGAGHPLVFGDSLLAYLNQLVSMFNSHTHPGQLAAGVLPVTPAPPAPPFPAASSSMLSVKVKTG